MPGSRKQIRVFLTETKCQRYLEIGFGNGIHVRSISTKEKVIISLKCYLPRPHNAYEGESDTVFASDKFKQEKPFDVIFIDGLHYYPQIIRDIDNSLKFLNPNGVIICHDINPFQMRLDKVIKATKYPMPKPKPETWLGDSWKAFLHVKFLRSDLCYANILTFPGYMVLWKTPSSVKRVMDYGKYVESNINDKYPYLNKTVKFGIKHQDEYEFTNIDKALEKYRSRKE